MTELHKSRSFVGGLFLVFCVIWFYALGARTLVPTDEGRYAEMAREMLASGDWITPRLNGLKYFEKPPLQNWMNALTFAAFGLGEWQARLWTGLTGLFGVLITAFAACRLYGSRVGFHAGLVLGSSLLWAAMSHANTLDMGLASMMSVALCSLLVAQREGASVRERRHWMWACWAGMALAVMSKGLIGIVLPGAVLVIYTLASRDWAIWKRLHLVSGLLLFFAITAPWFILISLRNPEFPHFFFIHEHFQRFTSKVHRREGPWHYFFPFLIAGIIPWVGLLAQSLMGARKVETEKAHGFQPAMLLLIWCVFIFFFFSISGSKLPSYILPIFPALAILIALELERASARTLILNASLVALAGAAGLVYAGRIPKFAGNTFEQPLYAAYAPWVMTGAAIALVGGIIAMGYARRQRGLAIVVLGMAGFISGQVLLLGHEPLGRYKAGLDHVPAMARELAPDTPIYAVQIYEQSIPFYLGRTVILVAHTDEMEFGIQQEPHRWIPERAEFIRRWNNAHAQGSKAMAIANPEAFAQLQKLGLPMRVIARDPRRVIVTNDPKP
jgi:4-amino-4-deoxy-L-arabinose transferase-like glycosyltransferase